MTTNPLDEIQARADAATEGPWAVEPYEYCEPGYERSRVTSAADDDDYNTAGEVVHADATFIAHAREDVPKLVAALRAVESVCRNLWAESAEGNAIIRESGLTQDAVLRVRAAIREALG